MARALCRTPGSSSTNSREPWLEAQDGDHPTDLPQVAAVAVAEIQSIFQPDCSFTTKPTFICRILCRSISPGHIGKTTPCPEPLESAQPIPMTCSSRGI